MASNKVSKGMIGAVAERGIQRRPLPAAWNSGDALATTDKAQRDDNGSCSVDSTTINKAQPDYLTVFVSALAHRLR
jgi:hypothetical protein